MAKTTFKDVPVDTLKLRLEEAEQARKKDYEDNWEIAKNMYDGKQWEGIDKIAWYQSEPVYNKIFEYVEIMRAYLADNKWSLDIFPITVPESMVSGDDIKHEEVAKMVDKVNDVLDFIWEDTGMQDKLAQVVLLSFLYGTGFLKLRFNPNDIGDFGIGRIEVEVMPPRYVYPDPFAASVRDASFIIERHPVPLRWVYENYPDMYEEVVENLSPAESEIDARGSSGPSVPSDSMGKTIDILECWYHDSSIVEDEESGKVKKAYPNGRYTLMTGNDVVLDDKPNPYTMFPYVRFIELPRPGEFWGDATITRAVGIQQNINTLLRTIIDNGLWMSHGIWVVDSTSGVSADSLAGYGPRACIVKNPGSEVRRDTGDSVPQGIFQTLEQQVAAFDQVVGLPDVLRGIVPSRQPVGTVQMQKEAGDVRTRERQRRVESSLKDLGELWLDIVQHFWTDKRVIRTTGKGSAGTEMFRFSKKDLEDWKFNLHVLPGSTAPTEAGEMLAKVLEIRGSAGVPVSDEFVARIARIPGLETDVTLNKAEMMKATGDPGSADAPIANEVPMELPPEMAGMPPEPMPGPMPPDMGMPPGPPPGPMPPDMGGMGVM